MKRYGHVNGSCPPSWWLLALPVVAAGCAHVDLGEVDVEQAPPTQQRGPGSSGGDVEDQDRAEEAGSDLHEDDLADVFELPSHGRFVLFELHSPEPKKAASFYEALLGWKAEWLEDLGEGAPVAEFHSHGVQVALLYQRSPGSRFPIGWLCALAVADIPETIRAVEARGGEVLDEMLPSNRGSTAIIKGPTEGVLRLIRPSEEVADNAATAARLWYWAQLWTGDLTGALAFYAAVGRYASREVQDGKNTYHLLQAHGNAPAGMIARTPSGQQNRWFPVARVADVAATTARARQLGARVVSEARSIDGIDALAVIQTPAQGVMGFTSQPPPGP